MRWIRPWSGFRMSFGVEGRLESWICCPSRPLKCWFWWAPQLLEQLRLHFGSRFRNLVRGKPELESHTFAPSQRVQKSREEDSCQEYGISVGPYCWSGSEKRRERIFITAGPPNLSFSRPLALVATAVITSSW